MIRITIALFLSGLLFGSGPCLASCGPLLISYVAGTGKNIFKGLISYTIFSIARISVYLVLALVLFFLGRFALGGFLNISSRYILIFGGVFVILVGLLMLLGKRLEFSCFQIFLKNIFERDKKNLVIFGLVTGLLPCAPLLAILSYIGLVSKSLFESLGYSLSFGVGTFVSPLMLLVMLAGLIPKFFINKSALLGVFNSICGGLIVFLGVQLIMRAF